MEIISVGSSSSGNAYIIKADGHVLILDVGLTARSINEALAELGVKPEDVDAVLITHEHDIAAMADRILHLEDGKIISDTGIPG